MINVDMPANCFECPCCDDNKGMCNVNWNLQAASSFRPEGCPLMEVRVHRKKADDEKG